MLRWEKPKNENDVLSMAEKNCTAVSHEIMHELLRQSGYKRYIEDVHEVWQKHLFGALPFEQYDEDFKLTSKKPSFLALDTTLFGLWFNPIDWSTLTFCNWIDSIFKICS